MSHNGRIWYVRCLNTGTFEFVTKNLTTCVDETKMLEDVPVEVTEKGRKFRIRMNLIEIDFDGVQKLKISQKALGLSFRVYMRESRGAKVTPWNM